MPKVSPEHKEGVRRRIMDAAMTCLRRNNWDDITTREVLTEAGLSIGTFYNYFPSKDHLYAALAEDALTTDLSAVVSDGDPDRPLAVGLMAFLQDYIMNLPPGAGAVATFRGRMNAGPEATAAISRLNGYVVEEFVPLVEKAQADGWIRSDIDPTALVELLDMVWDGLGRRQATGTFQTSYQSVGEVLIAVILGGLLAPGIGPELFQS